MRTLLISHVEDHSIKLYAKGLILGGHFKGEYKHKGMTYGVDIPLSPLRLINVTKGEIVTNEKGMQVQVIEPFTDCTFEGKIIEPGVEDYFKQGAVLDFFNGDFIKI